MPNRTAKPRRIALISLHGLIRTENPELGRDADTGGQVKYVLELAAELSKLQQVGHVDLLTRQITDERVGPEYARLTEAITENATLVRIPFGPKRYLRKEALWPYIEVFVDHALGFFRRNGLPDVIHGHYADAGMAGAILARLLHVPYVFTGHSLGRIKRERLLAAGDSPANLEKKYRLKTRIEAEETALDTATMVVTSTNQEVQQQYQLYDHYAPERMEVIPPGVDLSAFHPAESNEDFSRVQSLVKPFLTDIERPMILTMARPDERKNLETLIRVYGSSPPLQELANLVILMGSRDDLREMEKGQRQVVNNVLTLIDVHNLYGKVAYPKSHETEDVHSLYRWAASLKGVFINPALTEPFGLTLLEAAASGLPIVATNDGGPRDIVSNCRNGLLIDPMDETAIEKTLTRALTDEEQWSTWSEQGIAGVNEHYSWKKHAERYVRDLDDILESTPVPALAMRPRARRLPEFDRLIITDLDNTLTGDDEALAEFTELVSNSENIGFGICTGRRLDDATKLIKELGLPTPDLMDTDAGTALHYGPGLEPDRSWRKQIGFNWKPDAIRELLSDVPGLTPQPEKNQSEYKISYTLDPEVAPKLTQIRRLIREAKLRGRVMLSLAMYLDVIPVRGGTDLTLRHLLWKWGFAPDHVLVAGDSGNDEGMLKGSTLGVVVGNHSPELNRLRKWPRIYFAEGQHARGILEGINYYQFLGHIVIPNDRVA